MKRQTGYVRVRLSLGLVSLVIGILALFFSFTHWEQRLSHLLSAEFARYLCTFGGLGSTISGSGLIIEALLVWKKSAEVRMEKASTVALLLILLCIQTTVVYSLVLYNSTILITPELQATIYSQALIGYRSSTGGNGLDSPKSRTWNGSVWASESELESAGSPVHYVRAASSPLEARSDEVILVTLSSDGYLDAYVWNGSSWLITNNIGFVGTTSNEYRCFDIEYEKTSGRGVLVYGVSSTDPTKDLAYKIWNGSQWSGENYINIATIGTDLQVYWVEMASKPTNNSDEIALICIDGTDSDAYGFIWDGNAWGNEKQFTNSVPTGFQGKSVENIGVAYEQVSGEATFIYAEGSDAYSWQWNGSTWDTSGTKFDLSGPGVPYWFSLKADPESDRLMALCIDDDTDLNTADWDGDSWTLHTEHDSVIDTKNRRCADIEWEPSGSKVLMVWSTTTNYLHYKTWTPNNGWSNTAMISMDSSHPWIQLRRNPRNVAGDTKIMGATIDGNKDLGSLIWDGSTLTGIAGAFTSDVGLPLNYESFELTFITN